MNVLRDITELASLAGPVALAIGVFDGVHLGHREVIQAALDFSEKHGGTPVVMTFDPHPMRVLRPDLAPRLLCSGEHKLHILKQFGVSHTLVCPFTPEMGRMDATQFIGMLVESCKPLGFISVGYTWSFGKGRQGNIHQLMELGQANDFGVYGVPEVKVDAAVVSSTRIREAVREGDFAKAKRLLGRDYTVLGKVVYGKQLGRQLGFPTANVAIENEELPPNGVYAVEVENVMSGWRAQGVANLGVRPTIGTDERSLEVHVFDFAGDLYGENLEVTFVQQLREERKFASMDELKAQIARDSAAAREILFEKFKK